MMELTSCFSSKEERTHLLQEYGITRISIPRGEKSFVLKLSLPVIDVHSLWHYFLPTPCERIPWVVEISSSFQRGMPFISFFSKSGRNMLSAGLTDLRYDVAISARMNQETCCYDITFAVTAEGVFPETIGFFADFRPVDWQSSLGEWRRSLGIPATEFPASVWNPVYCTWYAAHAAMDAAWCEKTARGAEALGFKTFIIDDGWCYDDFKRVSPATISSWYEWVGDWKVSGKKFPDFKAHVSKVRNLGMRYLVWVAPFLIGVKSDIYRRLKDVPGALCGEYLEGYVKLNPSNETASAAMVECVGSLVERYDLDGLKVDFLDQIFPDQKDPHSAGCERFISALSARIRKTCPDALIEFRQSYATPQMIPYGTQFRAGDAPFDFMLNFKRLAQIRLCIGTLGPIHADPAYWHPDELNENISRHMIAMLAGVPMLSVDPESLSDREKRIIGHWINFYTTHMETFRSAEWRLGYRNADIVFATADGKSERIAIVNDARRVEEAIGSWRGKSCILNLSDEELTFGGMRGFDCFGVETGNNVAPKGGYLQN